MFRKNILMVSFVGILFCILMSVCIDYIKGSEHQAVLSGYGTAKAPYLIYTNNDFKLFADGMQQEDSPYHKAYVSLMDDLLLSGEYNACVVGDENMLEPFSGVFEGNGHYIKGLRYKNKDGNAGLFPELRGTVRNLRVEECVFEGENAGGIAGSITQSALIINCYSDVKIFGNIKGGICGASRGSIENCYYYGEADVAGKRLSGGKQYNSFSSNYDTDAENVLNSLNGLFTKIMPGCIYKKWELDAGKIKLSDEDCAPAGKIYTECRAGTDVLEFGGLFSAVDRCWHLCIPEKYASETWKIKIENVSGEVYTVPFENCKKEVFEGFNSGYEEYKGNVLADGYDYDIVIDVVRDVPFLYLENYEADALNYVNDVNGNLASCTITSFDEKGNIDVIEPRCLFYGRGNDSFLVDKKGYTVKLPTARAIADMEASTEYNLIPGYRDKCLFTYVFTRDLYKDIKSDFAHDYRLINLYVDGQYQGLYFLTEKVDISDTAFNLRNLNIETKKVNSRYLNEFGMTEEGGEGINAQRAYYNIPRNPQDITGGYILEMDQEAIPIKKARFRTKAGIMMSCKSNPYLSKEELIYIEELWQDLEDAAKAQDGKNDKGIYYADYIDMESFADQWIMYDVAMEKSMLDSVYYYKDSDFVSDGKIHAVFHWDVEHAYVHTDVDRSWNMRHVEAGEEGQESLFTWLYMHDDFKKQVRLEWEKKIRPALTKTFDDEKRDNSDGLGTFSWYREFGKMPSVTVNDNCWDEGAFLKKTDILETVLKGRIEFLDDYYK